MPFLSWPSWSCYCLEYKAALKSLLSYGIGIWWFLPLCCCPRYRPFSLMVLSSPTYLSFDLKAPSGPWRWILNPSSSVSLSLRIWIISSRSLISTELFFFESRFCLFLSIFLIFLCFISRSLFFEFFPFFIWEKFVLKYRFPFSFLSISLNYRAFPDYSIHGSRFSKG